MAVSGDVTISGGTLAFASLASANQIADTATITLQSGELNLANHSETIGAFLFSGGTFTPGTGTLTLTNSGTALLLAGSANVAGNIALSGNGNVLATAGSPTISGSTFDLGSGAHQFTVSSGVALGISAVVQGGGSIAVDGLGTLQLTANNTNFGPIAISSGGTLQIGSGGTTGTLGDGSATNTVLIGSGATLTLNRSDSYTVSNAISGSGAFVVNGSGTKTLTGVNSGAWTTAINGGTVQIASQANIGSGNFSLNGGTLYVTGAATFATQAVALGVSGGAIQNDGLVTFQTGEISGTTSLTKTGAGTLTLQGDSSLQSWSTNFNGGKVSIAAANNIGTGNFSFAGGTLQVTEDATLQQAQITLGTGGGAIQVDNLKTATLQNTAIIGSSSLTKTGLGTLALTGIGTGSWSTTVSGGTLHLNSSGIALPGDVMINGGNLTTASGAQIATTANMVLSLGSFTMNGNESLNSLTFTGGALTSGGATLSLSSAGTALSMAGNAQLVGNISLTDTGSAVTVAATSGSPLIGNGSSSTLNLGSGTRIFDISSGTTLEISGQITETTTTAITKTAGTGTLLFTGTTVANNYSGTTTISAGTVQLNKTGVNAIVGPVTIFAGGTLSSLAANQIGDSVAMTLSGGTYTMGGDENIQSLIYSSGTLTQNGNLLTLGSVGTALTLSGTANISGNIALTGSGTVAVTGATSAPTISGSTIDLGSSFHTVTIASGSSLVIFSSIQGTGGITTTTNLGTIQFSGTSPNTYSGLTTVSAGTVQLNKTAGVDAIAGAITVSGGTLSSLAANQIKDTSAMLLSGGTYTMGGAEKISSLDFSSGTLTQNGNTLSLDSAGTALALSGSVNMTGSLALTGAGSAVKVTSSAATAGTTISLSGATFDLGSNTRTFEVNQGILQISSVIQGSGGMTKTGATTFTLSGASPNTYSGPTTVSAGTLTLSKATAVTGNVTINNGTVQYGAVGAVPANSLMAIGDGTGAAGSATFAILASTVMTSSTALSADINSDGLITLATNATGYLTSLQSAATTASITLSAGNTGTANLFDIAQNTDTTYAGSITGGFFSTSTNTTSGNRFVKEGAGTLSLSGASSFTSRTFLSNGTISMENGSCLGVWGSSSAVYVRNWASGAGTLEINGAAISTGEYFFLNGAGYSGGGALRSVNGANTVSGNVTIGWSSTGGDTSEVASPVTIKVDGTSLTFSGIVSGAQPLTKIGSGMLIYSGAGANTHSGATTISNGSLLLSKPAALALGGNAVIGAGGTLEIAGTTTNQIADTATITLAGGTFKVNGNSETIGSLIFNSGTLSLGTPPVGTTASLTLTSTAANALSMQNTTIPSNGVNSIAFTAAGGVTYITSATKATISGGIDLGAGFAHTFTIPAATDTNVGMEIDGVVSNTGSIVKTGSGTLLFSADNTYSGGTTISAGTVQVGSGGSSGGIGSGAVVDNGALVFNRSGSYALNNTLSGNGTLMFTGGGNVTIGGTTPNTYTGLTTIADVTGSVSLNKPAGVAAIGGNVAISGGSLIALAPGQVGDTATVTLSGGTYDMGGFDDILGTLIYTGGTLAQRGGTLTLSSSGTALSMSDMTIAGNIAFSSTGGVTYTASATKATLAGGVDLGAGFAHTLTIPAAFDTSVGMEISGVISNTGSITKAGNGTLLFTAANNYSGTTTISAGTLQIGLNGSPAGQIGSGAVTNNGILLFKRDGDYTVANSLSGSGSLQQQGTGILTLSGTNTYSGGTAIGNGGVIRISNAANIGDSSSTSLTLQKGTLQVTGAMTLAQAIVFGSGGGTIDNSAAVTLNGLLSGSAPFIKSGAAELKINNASNNSSGTWLLDEGTLSVGGSGVLGTATLQMNGNTTFKADGNGTFANEIVLVSSGTAIDTNGFNLTFNGDVAELGGAQALTKKGTGVLTLNSLANSFTGGAVVEEGRLAIIGEIASGVTVFPGAILSGTGVITGNVTIDGTLQPGASVGTLQIIGNYTQGASSFFENEITPSTSDKLIVHGDVSIIGNGLIGPTFILQPDISLHGYREGTSYTVIQSIGGSVSGRFLSPVTSTAPLISGFLTYSGDEVILTLGTRNVSTFQPMGNAGAVAQVLNAVGLSGDSALDGIITSILNLDEEQVNDALNQMHVAPYRAMAIVQENNALQVGNALSQRFQSTLDLKACCPLEEAVALLPEASENPQQNLYCCSAEEVEEPANLLPHASKKHRHNSSCLCAKQVEKPIDKPKEQKIQLWATGIGDFLKQDDTVAFASPQVGYHASGGGIVVGSDYRFTQWMYLGALGGYTHSDIKWYHNQAQGGIDSSYAGLYTSAIGKWIYANLSAVSAWSGFSESRNIIYTGVSKTAINTHRGSQLTAHADAGLNLGWCRGFTLRPYDLFDWIVQQENSYVESGAGEYNLSVQSSLARMLRNELGMAVAGCRWISGCKTSLDVKAAWVREVRLKGSSTTSAFVEAKDKPFTVFSYFPNRNLLSVGGTITVQIPNERLNCSIYGHGNFGKKYVESGFGFQINLKL